MVLSSVLSLSHTRTHPIVSPALDRQDNVAIVYKILNYCEDIKNFCPFGNCLYISCEEEVSKLPTSPTTADPTTGGPGRRLREDAAVPEQGERKLDYYFALNFLEWVQAIEIYYPNCILAPVTSGTDLMFIQQLADAAGTQKAMLGVFKDPLEAQRCDVDGEGCLDGWMTFEGTSVAADPSFFSINGDGYGYVASVGVLDFNSGTGFAGIYDQADSATYEYAAIKCTLDPTQEINVQRLTWLTK